MDWHKKGYSVPCSDCANLYTASARVVRGGSFYYGSDALLSGARYSQVPEQGIFDRGFRCAREP